MGKLRYTKDQLEKLVLIQISNLDELSFQVKLLREQNQMLVSLNHKLVESMAEEQRELKPYLKRAK